MPKTPPIESQWKVERERLAAELQRLEEALLDARSGSGDNEDGSLVSKLREATKKRVRIEEEFERSSDRWRDERRDLTAEIDQLDRALAKARAEARKGDSSRKSDDSKLRRQLSEAKDSLRALEKEFDKDRAAWTASTETLEKKIGTLEASLVDALERANNAARGEETRDAVVKARVETHRHEIESQLRGEFEGSLEEQQKAVKALEDECAQLHLEIHRLKSAAEKAAPAPAAPETRGSRFSLSKLRKGKSQDEPVATPDPTLSARVEELEKELAAQTSLAREATERAAAAEAEVTDFRETAATAPETGVEGEALAAAWNEERERLEARVLELEAAAGEIRNASPGETDGAELITLRAEADAWNLEREALNAQLAEVRTSLDQTPGQDAGANERLTALEAQLAERDNAIAGITSQMETAAKTWDEERETLTLHAKSLEASLADAQSAGSAHAGSVNALESQLGESQKSLQELEARYKEESGAWADERKELSERISQLEFSLKDATAGQADITDQYEQLLAEFEEARKTANHFQEQVGVDARDWSDEQASLKNQIEELQASLKEARDADASADAKTRTLVAKLEAAEQKLSTDSEKWSAERKQLEASTRDLVHQLEDATQTATTEHEWAETQLQEIEAARQGVANDLEQARAELAAATKEHEEGLAEARELETSARAEFENQKAGLEKAADQLAGHAKELEEALDESRAKEEGAAQETAQLSAALGEARQALAALDEEFRTKASEWETERSEFRQELKKLRQAQSNGKSLTGSKSGKPGSGKSVADLEARRQALEVRLLESEESKDELANALKAATEEWEAERHRLAEQLGDMDHAIESASKKDKAELDARHAGLMQKVQEAEGKYTSLENASLEAAKEWDKQRAQLEQEIAQWEQQVVAEAERVAEETKKALQEEYDMQLRELQSQKEQLEAQLQSSQGGVGNGDADPALIAQEIARADQEIDEINLLIEDPNAALSNVMRKNAERSELKAYRRGLSYLAERIASESQKE